MCVKNVVVLPTIGDAIAAADRLAPVVAAVALAVVVDVVKLRQAWHAKYRGVQIVKKCDIFALHWA